MLVRARANTILLAMTFLIDCKSPHFQVEARAEVGNVEVQVKPHDITRYPFTPTRPLSSYGEKVKCLVPFFKVQTQLWQ